MLDRFFDQGESAEGEVEEGAQEEAGQGKQVAQRQQGGVVVTPEDALQVARMMPSPTEGGLASFFDHLAQTQVRRFGEGQRLSRHFMAYLRTFIFRLLFFRTSALLGGSAGTLCSLPMWLCWALAGGTVLTTAKSMQAHSSTTELSPLDTCALTA